MSIAGRKSSPDVSPRAAMIGEDFGSVRVLATGGVAVFYGGGSMCAHRTKKPPRARPAPSVCASQPRHAEKPDEFQELRFTCRRGLVRFPGKDLAVTAGAVVTVLAGLIAALDYMLDAKLEPVKSELASIREDLRKMDERYERRLSRLEGLHLAPTSPDTPAERDA